MDKLQKKQNYGVILAKSLTVLNKCSIINHEEFGMMEALRCLNITLEQYHHYIPLDKMFNNIIKDDIKYIDSLLKFLSGDNKSVLYYIEIIVLKALKKELKGLISFLSK